MLRLALVVWALSSVSSAHGSEISEKKIRRIIQVSAAYFDLNLWGEPASPERRVDVDSSFSFLPKIKEKEFSQDMPWVHGIPRLTVSTPLQESSWLVLGSSAWFGALPPGIEKLAAAKAKPHQWLLGGAFHAVGLLESWHLWATLGFQTSRTKIAGLERPLKVDLESQSTLQSLSLGGLWTDGGIWGSVTTGLKDTDVLVKGESGLLLAQRDTLSESGIPLWWEFSVGWDWEQWRFAVSELWLPSRLFMPRVLVSKRLL